MPEFKLSDYKTYNFYQVEVNDTIAPAFLKRVKWIEDAISDEMQTNGLHMDEEDPDLLLNIGIAVVENTQTRETDIVSDAFRYIGNMNYSWQSETVEVQKYHTGTFVLHFVDAASHIILCEAIAESVIVTKDKQSKKNIIRGTRKLFRQID